MTLLKENVCPSCGRSSQTLFVHGLKQSEVCKTNVESFCQDQGLEGGMNDK